CHGTQEQKSRKLRRFSGPLGSGETETIRPRSGRVQGCTRVFVSTGCAVENPGSGSRTCEAGADVGCPSLWLLSLGQARESDSAVAKRMSKAVERERPREEELGSCLRGIDESDKPAVAGAPPLIPSCHPPSNCQSSASADPLPPARSVRP